MVEDSKIEATVSPFAVKKGKIKVNISNMHRRIYP